MSQELQIQRMEQSDLVQIQRLYEELLAGGISMEVLERQFAAVSNREPFLLCFQNSFFRKRCVFFILFLRKFIFKCHGTFPIFNPN